jgi:hypothetical protein
MDKVGWLTKPNPAEREDFEAFMLAVRGVPAYRVAFAVNKLTPGTDWRGCSKSQMAVEWAQREHAFIRKSMKYVTLEKLAKAVAEVQQRYA